MEAETCGMRSVWSTPRYISSLVARRESSSGLADGLVFLQIVPVVGVGLRGGEMRTGR